MIKINGKTYKFENGIIKNYKGKDIELEKLLKFSPYLDIEYANG